MELKELKGKPIDVQKLGGAWLVPVEDLTEEQLKEHDFIDELGQCSYVAIYEEDEANYNLSGAEWDWAYSDCYQELLDSIPEYPAYLIVLHNSRWTGASGAGIVGTKGGIFHRDYDCSQYIAKVSRSGKRFEMTEHHHDCPTGHRTVVVGLTAKERSRVDNMSLDEKIIFGG